MSVPGGYDEEFVDSISDHLKCVICCHVLKHPVQIMSCGHRYCALCFEQIKTYSQHLRSPLICPVDREDIDIAQVFSDKGMDRMINDLKVRCSFHKEGCQWIGELRNLNPHKSICQYVESSAGASQLNKDHAALIREMSSRMDKCEEALYEKEKEICHMKLALQQTKEKVDTRDGEITLLKKTTEQMEKEISSLKERNKILQETMDTALLKCQNNYLTNKTEVMRLDKVVEKLQYLNEDEVDRLKVVVEEANKHLAENKTDVARSIRTIETGLQKVHKKVEKIEDDIHSGEVLVAGAEQGTSIKDQVHNVEETVKKESEMAIGEVFEELDILRGQQLCVRTLHHGCTRFPWIINSFKERWQTRKQFESPKFYCLPEGYLCQLYCKFMSCGSNDMGLFFRLCRGRNTPVTDFKASITLDLMCRNGTKKSSYIILGEDKEHKKEHKDECLTIKTGEDYSGGYGPSKFFDGSKFNEYVQSDRCVVICAVTPAS